MSDIAVSTEEEFADIRIPIKAVSFANDGAANISVEGNYKGNKLGLELTVKGHMRPGIVDDDVDTSAFYEQGIIVRLPQDSVVTTMLASQYGVQPEVKAQCRQLH